MTTIPSALVALTLMIPSLPVGAETLDQALADAWQNNPNLAAARAGTSAARHDLRAAHGGWYPHVSLNGQLSEDHTEGTITLGGPARPISDTLDQTSLSLDLNQPIWAGGRLSSRIDAASSQVEASRARTSARGSQVLLNAVKAYTQVVAAQKLLKVQENNIKVIRHQKETAQSLLQHGEGTQTDVAQARARLQGANAKRIHAAANLDSARATYRVRIGHAPAQELAFPETSPQLAASLKAATQLAANNFNVRSARSSADVAAAHAELAGHALMPELSLFARIRRAREPQYGFQKLNDAMIGLNLSVPIWSGGTLRAQKSAARDKARQARLQLQSTRDQARGRVVSAWHAYAAAKAAYKANGARLKASKTAYDGVLAEHHHGERTLLDVLDAEQEVRDAEAARIQSRQDRIVAAYALLAVTGQLTPEALDLARTDDMMESP